MEESESGIILQELSNHDQDEVKKKGANGKEEREKQDFEDSLMSTIKRKDVEGIIGRLNPRALTKCKTNTLYMAMKASSALRRIADQKGPHEEQFIKLANSVDEFSYSLLNPLTSDEELRHAFADSLDDVMDAAIEMEQKKTLTHPVLYRLMSNKWFGEFHTLKRSSLLSIQYLKWCFLNIWCVIDVLLFPVLFVLFYIIHICRDKARKKRGVDGKDIYDSYRDYFATPYFVFIRDALSYLVLLGLHFTICLETSSISFTWIEWAILVFFMGRALFEREQFTNHKDKETVKNKTRHCRRVRCNQSCKYLEEDVETKEQETKPQSFTMRFSKYITDRWNILDLITLIIYSATFVLRMATLAVSESVTNNRSLVIAGYFYGINSMFLTLRAFGHAMETTKQIGPIQIALFHILSDLVTIFWQFIATILAFSIAITKVYVAEKSFTSEDNGKELWWKMVRHLCWSLMGEVDVDLLESADDPSVMLVHFLYGAFLVMGAILLINMMIALLSNTYQKVQDNSLMEWSFKKAITIQTYSSCHPIPVPVNLVSFMLKYCGWQNCFSWCRNRKQRMQTARENGLEDVVKRLESLYFAEYGYLFPLTDERKLDRVLLETRRNRQMANQIAQFTFTASHSSDKNVPPTGPQAWHSKGISVEECLLTCEGAKLCDICKPEDGWECHWARYIIPFSLEFPHFEVLIQETGDRRFLGIGAVWEGYEASHFMPGWSEGTVGYHIDDGKIFHAENPVMGKEVQDAMAYRGDLIGCTIKFEGITNGKVPVVFTLNGKRITEDEIWIDYTPGGKLMYPYIFIGHQGMRVLAKMRPSREIPYEQQIFRTMKRERGSRSSDLELEQLVIAIALNDIKEMKETVDADCKKFKKEVQKIRTHLMFFFDDASTRNGSVPMDRRMACDLERQDIEMLFRRPKSQAEEEERKVPITVDLWRTIRRELEDLGKKTKEKTDDMLQELAQLKSDAQLQHLYLKSENEGLDKKNSLK